MENNIIACWYYCTVILGYEPAMQIGAIRSLGSAYFAAMHTPAPTFPAMLNQNYFYETPQVTSHVWSANFLALPVLFFIMFSNDNIITHWQMVNLTNEMGQIREENGQIRQMLERIELQLQALTAERRELNA